MSFSSAAHLLLPFSKNRALLDRAIESQYLARVENSSESQIYESVFLAARELFQGRTGRKAIVLLTDGQDSGLGLTWDPRSALPNTGAGASRLAFDDVARELGADGIALFIVSTENRPRGMTPEWLETHRSEMLVTAEARKQNMPNYTLYLAELARRAGGQLYFLREIGNLSEIYRRIALGDQRAIHAGLLSFGGNRAPRLALAARRAGRRENSGRAQSSLIAARTMFLLFSRIFRWRIQICRRGQPAVCLPNPRTVSITVEAISGLHSVAISAEDEFTACESADQEQAEWIAADGNW